MRSEVLNNGHHWLRIAGATWDDPLDPSHAQRQGGRWNPPDSYPTLYLNEDLRTARVNMVAFIERWPYEPEDLRNDHGPVLVTATLPRGQEVADIHSDEGLAAVGLPVSYPSDGRGAAVPHSVCQLIGQSVKDSGLRGVLCLSANSLKGAGRELAWFPARSRSHATSVEVAPYEDWFWGPMTTGSNLQ
jgi:hypothetical protein